MSRNSAIRFNAGLSHFIFYLIWCYLCVNTNVSAKNLNANGDVKSMTCEHTKQYFDSMKLNVTINVLIDSSPDSENAGEICNGHCCDKRVESELVTKSTSNFERLVRHHTRSHRGIWESTASIFRDHVLELSRQSENKTLNLFSQVYRKMSPLSRQPILELYKSIRSHISSKTYEDDLESVVNRFFVNLFPVAYHHAVHTELGAGGTMPAADAPARDFHSDYKSCLTHTYKELQPFGEVPKMVTRSLVQSVDAATTFVRALDQGAEVLAGIEALDSDTLTHMCKARLVKMSYCASCKGLNNHHAKPCYGFCVNVMRGCLTQYIGTVDKDWYNFSESIEKLMDLVRSKDGIEAVIKSLDAKLSEAIMYAMENGPELEKKVKKLCGAPSLHQTDKPIGTDVTVPPHYAPGNKWNSPPDTQMLQFLVSLHKPTEFFMRIADSLCEDDDYQRLDRDCWTGDHIGDYQHAIISIHTQKYNPEVPMNSDANYPRDSKLYSLNDKLVNLKKMVLKPLATHSKLDADKMQADMSFGSGTYPEDEYDNLEGSGSGDYRSHDGIAGKTDTPKVNIGVPVSADSPRISSFTTAHAFSIVFVIVFFRNF